MPELATLPLVWILAVFAVAAAVVAVSGVAMTATADRLADRTGLGEAVVGGVLLGASTSLPGIVTSVTAAAEGHPQLAVSNAVGGIAAQTFFLAVADTAYRRANLEHAAASITNLTQGALLLVLLSLVLVGTFAPEVSVLGVHPVSLLLLLGYGFGLRLVSRTSQEPMWGPRQTDETEVDVPDEPAGGARTLAGLALRFAFLALVTGAAGYLIAHSGILIAERTGLGESVVGALFTAVSTSLPELVTTVAAVRRGALTLAVGGIVGGNTFDVLFVAFADVGYRPGSIYHAIAEGQLFMIALAMLMTGVVVLGLLRRERHGIGGIGFESVLLIVFYLGGVIVLFSR